MSPGHKPTIAACFVKEALAGSVARGFDAQWLLQQAGIPAEVLTDPRARVSAQQYGALWHLTADLLDDEFFGLGRRPMKRGSFALLCHAIISSTNLEQALRRALRFLRLVVDDVEGCLRLDGDHAEIVLLDHPSSSVGPPGPPHGVYLYSAFLVIVHGVACWLIGKRIPLLQVWFRSTEPGFRTELMKLFADDIRFSCDHSGIRFDAAFLRMRNSRSLTDMKRFLRNAPANFLVKYKDLNSLSSQVRRHLRTMEPAVWPSFPMLAQQMGLSPATLRRRLTSEGNSYRLMIDELRQEQASALLADPSLSISQVAEKLGFTEYSSFYRAFRQWTGSSPRAFRRTLAAPSQGSLD